MIVKKVWNQPVRQGQIANMIYAKFKNLIYELKRWVESLSHIKTIIEKCNLVIFTNN
jgi:hypothetical protein